jgi:hypothetical protein
MINLDSESRELIVIGHAFAVANEAGQIFRLTPGSDSGIDGVIEFRNEQGDPGGKCIYLLLSRSVPSMFRITRNSWSNSAMKGPITDTRIDLKEGSEIEFESDIAIESRNESREMGSDRAPVLWRSIESSQVVGTNENREILVIKEPRYAEYWKTQAYPVMLAVRTSDGQIQWMNVTDFLRNQKKPIGEILFKGEAFTALSLIRLGEQLPPK